jgi:hypothetical protein
MVAGLLPVNAAVASNVVHTFFDQSHDMTGRYGGPAALQALTVSALRASSDTAAQRQRSNFMNRVPVCSYPMCR